MVSANRTFPASGMPIRVTKAGLRRTLKEIRHSYEDDIAEFWLVVASSAEGRSCALTRENELEGEFPHAHGSLKNNPVQIRRYPHSLGVPIKILLVYQIILAEAMARRYKDFFKEPMTKAIYRGSVCKARRVSDIVCDCENVLKRKKSRRVLRTPLGKFARGYVIRNLVIHNGGVMDKRTCKQHYPNICRSICDVGEEAPLEFSLIYDVHEGLTAINKLLYREYGRVIRNARSIVRDSE